MKETGPAHDAQTSEPTRQRILDAAIRLFCQRGYHATSVREIVAAAGVTKPVLYYYFQSKEDLFHCIVRDATDELRADLTTACSATYTSFAQNLHAISDVFCDAARAYPEAVRFIHTIAFSGLYNHVLDFTAYWQGNVDLLSDAFSRAQAAGWVRRDISPRTAAFHFLSLAMGAMRAIVYFPEIAAAEPIEASIVPLFLQAVDGPPPPRLQMPAAPTAHASHLPSRPASPLQA